jgi:hypothetical protein
VEKIRLWKEEWKERIRMKVREKESKKVRIKSRNSKARINKEPEEMPR